jgi:hypothetical protein
VEAPGTAPGSERFIPIAVYRHSRLVAGNGNIGMMGGMCKWGRVPATSKRNRTIVSIKVRPQDQVTACVDSCRHLIHITVT